MICRLTVADGEVVGGGKTEIKAGSQPGTRIGVFFNQKSSTLLLTQDDVTFGRCLIFSELSLPDDEIKLPALPSSRQYVPVIYVSKKVIVDYTFDCTSYHIDQLCDALGKFLLSLFLNILALPLPKNRQNKASLAFWTQRGQVKEMVQSRFPFCLSKYVRLFH